MSTYVTMAGVERVWNFHTDDLQVIVELFRKAGVEGQAWVVHSGGATEIVNVKAIPSIRFSSDAPPAGVPVMNLEWPLTSPLA